MGHRLLVESACLGESRVVLPKSAARHLKVLRPKRGERIELFDGRGAWRDYAWADGALEAAGERRLAARPAGELVLFACVTKGSRWDWTLEKATELGATRIVPVISERTIVRLAPGERAAKGDRWRRIVEEAARQSDAKWLPEVWEAVDFADSLALVSRCRCLVGALTDPPSGPIGSSEGDAVYVGPEGDFTPEELAALVEIATPVSFGPQVLRAETAAIFALSVLAARRLTA